MPAITMPQLGESVTEGTIGRWLKKPGERVARDEPLVEVVTDKVNAEIPAPMAGILERVTASEGQVVAVGQEIAFLATDDDLRDGVDPARRAPAAGRPNIRPDAAAEAEIDTEEPRSSPLVRKLAKEHGIDLRQIKGSGQGGRVTREDVEAYLEQRAAASVVTVEPEPKPPAPPTGATGTPAVEARDEDRIAPSPMRRTIAQRMVQSTREIPHAWLMVEVDATRLTQLREGLKESFRQREGVDLTYVPFALKAVADALRELPIVNSTWLDGQIILKREINLGVAVALDDGLVVPVIRDAERQSIVGLAHRLADLVARARAGKLTLADVEGGTFTVNNSGAFGSIASQPIINYPQAAILNLEAIVKRAVVVDDAIAIRSMVNLCLSFDHRIMDGLTAGRFLQAVKRNLEAWGPGSAL